MSESKQNGNFVSINKLPIIVLTHNPKGKWGDVRDTIEQGLYKGWGKAINVEIDQLALIYISKSVREIQYIMQVVNVYEDSIDLKLVKKLDEETKKQLTYTKLVENGLKPSTINYILNNNEKLYNYVTKVIYGELGENMKKLQALNQILYGPPGTGKTYHTIDKTLEIIDGMVPTNREEAKAKFEAYKQAGQIEFVTFHQSYGYEEFVEGIKAIPVGKEGNESEEMIYDVVDGIFKKLCNNAQKKKLFYIGQKIGNYEIMSLTSELMKLKRINGSLIPIPIYLLDEILTLIDKKLITTEDINNKIAIEKMSPEAEKFIINGYPNVFRDLAQYYIDNSKIKEANQNYILIIDEINRGNISKIFGELITLIEESKRIGKEEALHVRLPYSNEFFGVPQNLYIIGTMNTADRSIALMDTALRRRFDFMEMMPDLATLSNNDNKVEKYNSIERQENDLMIGEINIRLLLQKINQRIEYLYDRDHTIGHAYFMSLKDKKITNKKAELDNIFKNKIIPLLQEYFYDDWEKIRLVLADNQKEKKEQTKELQFIKIKEDYDTKKLFGDSSYELLDDEATKVYEINNNAFKNIESYKIIYE